MEDLSCVLSTKSLKRTLSRKETFDNENAAFLNEQLCQLAKKSQCQLPPRPLQKKIHAFHFFYVKIVKHLVGMQHAALVLPRNIA